jgi:hypothetical protein
LSIIPGQDPLHSRRGELQHPLDIVTSNEMPGGTQDVGAEDTALIDGSFYCRLCCARRQAEAESPLRRAVLLRLHRAHPRDQLLGAAGAGPGDPLVLQSLICDQDGGRLNGIH